MTRLCRHLLLTLALAAAAQAGEEPKPPTKVKPPPVEEGKGLKFLFHDEATGELQWELIVAKATRAADNPRAIVGSTVRIISYHKGLTHTATSKTGTIDTETRSATLQGDVVIEFDDEQSTRVETDEITWDSKEGRAWTKSPVKISRKDSTTSGLGLRLWISDSGAANGKADRTNHLIVERRVRSVLLPNSNVTLFSDQGVAAPGQKPAEPIIITCDGSLTIYRTEMTAVYRDNVHAVQANQSLTCDQLTVTLRRVKGGEESAILDTVAATGNVRLDDSHTIALADAMLWSREQGSVQLIGRPAAIRWDNGNRIESGLIQRTSDGAEFLCSTTPDHAGSVYLLAYPGTGTLAVPDIGKPPAPKQEPGLPPTKPK